MTDHSRVPGSTSARPAPRRGRRACCAALGAVALSVLLSACGNGGSGDEVVILGNFPIAYAQRHNTAAGNPTDGINFAAGGDLFVKRVASASASACNITAGYTQGAGDVSDPEVSYAGDRLLFSMRGPNDSSWNIFEYDWSGSGDICSGQLTRLIADDSSAEAGDDVDPAYLPDGRIVFSSNRQIALRAQLVASGHEPFASRDEYERERAIVLHTLDRASGEISQISVNQSHDRNPTVLSSGELLFARWDHVGNRNHFPLFFANPDGTNLFVLYGAFSPGNSFLHPREMPDGRILSSLMSLSGTHEGGALVIVDQQKFSDNSHPVSSGISGTGQSHASLFEIPLGRVPSPLGRYTTPYPLWDGTNRALVSWRPQGLLQDELDPVSGANMQVEGPPAYGIYMLDLGDRSQRIVALPPAGMMLTDPVPVMARSEPAVKDPATLDSALVAAGKGILNVKSVYDTDFLDIMGDSVLVAGESLPRNAQQLPDLAALKDPALTSAAQRPARFLRIARAVPTPPGLMREEIGESDFEMQQILGYAQIEPDGSFRLEVPADTPLAIAVTDAEGRAFQTHTNWIQVRPGETRTCNGCHSPRRGSALNSLPIAGNHPNVLPGMSAGDLESMAETRTRLDATALAIVADPEYSDVWTDPNVRAPDTAFAIRYSGNANAADDLSTLAPSDGVINYVAHLQPIWDRACVACHSGSTPAGELDLAGGVSGNGRVASYESLLLGEPVIDPTTGLPEIVVQENEVMIRRETPLVDVGNSGRSARSSHLVERLFETELRAAQAIDDCAPSCTDHRALLNAAERRLIAEWIDLGAQYRNSPYADGAGGDGLFALSEVIGGLQGLSQATFESDVHPLLMARCAGCHQPFASNSGNIDLNAPNAGFAAQQFVLTGNLEGDFNIAVGQVGDVCAAAANALLARPAAIESDSPAHPSLNGLPVLPAGSPDAQPLLDWIAQAAAANNCP